MSLEENIDLHIFKIKEIKERQKHLLEIDGF